MANQQPPFAGSAVEEMPFHTIKEKEVRRYFLTVDVRYLEEQFTDMDDATLEIMYMHTQKIKLLIEKVQLARKG